MWDGLTIGQFVGWLSSLGVVGVAGYLARRLFERRRNRALDRQEEAKVRQIELSADGAQVANFDTLWNRTNELADKLLAQLNRTLECEKREAALTIENGELKAEIRHITATLKAEIQKTAAKEQELVELRAAKNTLEDRLNNA